MGSEGGENPEEGVWSSPVSQQHPPLSGPRGTLGPGDTGTRANSASQPASIHRPGATAGALLISISEPQGGCGDRNGEQEREGGREEEEDVGTQAENPPPTHHAGEQGAGGRPGRGGDNEMKRNVARLLEAWGRRRSGGPAGSGSGVTALAFGRAPGASACPDETSRSSIDFPNLISV